MSLEGDFVDHADDVLDLLRRGFDAAHGADGIGDHLSATGGDVTGAGGQLVGGLGIASVLAHGGGQFFHAGGGFFQGAGLLFRPFRQILGAGGHLRRRGGNLPGGLTDLGDDDRQLFRRLVDVVLQLTEDAVISAGDALAQVAIGQGAQNLGDIAQGMAGTPDHGIDALAQGQQKAVLAGGFDALVHIALGGGLGHFGDFGDDAGFAGALFGRGLAFGFLALALLLLHPLLVDGAGLEHLHRLGHFTDLVALSQGGDGGVEPTLGQGGHGSGHGADAASHRADDQRRQHGRQQQAAGHQADIDDTGGGQGFLRRLIFGLGDAGL
ncbi:MAG: hypothetical protein FD176_3354 [Rhodospirillaceae bacterium]|nr:MAG: hypothetical protein FD176_3354 [Rhodospirillaceae bacterium]